MKILFVDDEINVLKSFERMLRPKLDEWYMDFEDDPSQVGEKLKIEHFDVIVSDVFMKDVDGFAILKKVKDVSPNSEVLLITGAGTIESAVDAMRKGAWDYIQKPVNHNALLRKLEQLDKYFQTLNNAEETKLEKDNIESAASHTLVELEFKMVECQEKLAKVKEAIDSVYDAETKIREIQSIIG